MSTPNRRPMPASDNEHDASASPIPAFLKGNNSTVYRASAPTLTVQPPPSLFSYGGGGKSPAPLQFSNSPPLSDEWGMSEPAPRTDKKLGANFESRSFVSAEMNGSNMTVQLQQMSLSSSQAHKMHSNDEEVPAGSREASPGTISFICGSSDPIDVLRELSLVLERSIDFEMDFKKLRIRGIAYDHSERCVFAIQHCSEANQKHSVEFTRRRGSQRLFAGVLRQVRAKLKTNTFFSKIFAPISYATGLSAGSAAVWEGSNSVDAASCVALVQMCMSEFQDVQREALSSVATLVGVNSNAKSYSQQTYAACGPKLVDVLVNAARSNDMDVRWYMAFITAQMCALPEFVTAHAVLLLPLLFLLLAEPSTTENKGTKRQVSVAIQRLTKAPLPAELLPTVFSSLDVLESLYDAPDAELRAAVRLIVQQVS